MYGVAEYMYENACKYDLNRDEMYCLGLMHDIGYLYGKEDHEVLGSRLLEKLNMKYSSIISWHGTTPYNYMKLTDVSIEEIPKELILLWKADTSVNSIGKNVGFDERLKDIGTRLGFDSLAYKDCKEIINWLKQYNNNLRR